MVGIVTRDIHPIFYKGHVLSLIHPNLKHFPSFHRLIPSLYSYEGSSEHITEEKSKACLILTWTCTIRKKSSETIPQCCRGTLCIIVCKTAGGIKDTFMAVFKDNAYHKMLKY